MEKSKVYFTSFKTSFTENLMQKLARLVKTAVSKTLIFRIIMQQSKFILENMEIWHFCARIMQKSLQIS